jgi:hypothetical protein
MQRLRNVIRWAFLLLALAYIAWCAPQTIDNFREWRAAVPGNPVAADFWRSAFYEGVTDIIVVLVVGLATWLGLKPRKRTVAPSAQI